ncbi:hypothetical protein [Alkalibacillus aidingensis]|nr:hypothetical protein [Alkalibacillus aidingensis]
MKKLLVLTILLGAILGFAPTQTAVQDLDDRTVTVLDLPGQH